MRITILAVGSRGDFDPLLAFGTALAGRGHEVRLATHRKFEPRVAAGLDFAPLAEGEVSKGMATEQGRRWLRRGSRRLPTAVALLQDARSVARRRLEDALGACEHGEAIVAGELGLLLGWQMSQRYRVPLVRVRLSPPARIVQGPAAGAVRQAAWLAARLWLGSVRRQVGLGPLPMREPLGELEANGALELRAYSPSVVPSAGAAGSSRQATTGYWFSESPLDPEPSEELQRFIDQGAPPVCVGFGSMGTADPAAMRRLVVRALDGRRGVLVGDLHADGAGELPGSMFAVGAVDHGWLFERCAVAVHHGGAGTTAAALRAGVPSVIVPHMLDQSTWARRLHELGASPPPIPRRRLSTERLRRAIAAAVDDPSFARRTAGLRKQIADEHGIANALDAFRAHLGAAEPHVPTTTHG